MGYKPIRAYYSELVTNEHCTGDVWSNLPTHGLLKESHLPGVVITPACDLANDKVETISYLPIIPIRNYLATTSFLPEIKNAMLGISDQLNYTEFRTITSQIWPPSTHDLKSMKIAISELSETPKKKKLCERFLHLLVNLEKTTADTLMPSDMKSLSEGIGENAFNKLLNKIISNSYKNDIHYIPIDDQNPSWSVIREHSLIVFRYPLTAPIEIFNLAQTGLIDNWQKEVSFLTNVPMSKAFIDRQPIKTLRINPSFLHDILNRFVSLFSRIGSPDLTQNAIGNILKDLRGE